MAVRYKYLVMGCSSLKPGTKGSIGRVLSQHDTEANARKSAESYREKGYSVGVYVEKKGKRKK